MLLIGWRPHWFALAAALLLAIFATAMIAVLGPKPPRGYSVLSESSAALLLYAIQVQTQRNRDDS